MATEHKSTLFFFLPHFCSLLSTWIEELSSKIVSSGRFLKLRPVCLDTTKSIAKSFMALCSIPSFDRSDTGSNIVYRF